MGRYSSYNVYPCESRLLQQPWLRIARERSKAQTVIRDSTNSRCQFFGDLTLNNSLLRAYIYSLACELLRVNTTVTCTCTCMCIRLSCTPPMDYVYHPGWNGSRDCARSRGIAAILRANYAPFLRAKSPFNAKTR